MTQQKTALDRFLAAIPAAVASLILLAILFWIASARKSPIIFTDELEWTQISRAIADTGHAARRGFPVPFKSLYAFVIAPGWWIHPTAVAYDTIKYLNTAVMSLTAIPVYLLAQQLVSRRAATVAALGTLCCSALFYASFLIPEVLAFPVFALFAYVAVRALAGDGRNWIAATVVMAVVAVETRTELAMGVAATVLAAVWLWIVGPRGRKLRAGWSRADHVGVVVLLAGVVVVLNRLATPHAAEWNVVTGNFQGRIFGYAFSAGSALAIGLGVLPAIAGLASLWIPERRDDPRWRAFAAFFAGSIFTFGIYTGVKAAYLSTFFTSRTEERNLIYLLPLLLVGAVTFFSTRRTWWPGVAAAAAFVAWLVLAHGYQLGYPYFEAPGYGIATWANRVLRWDQPHIRNALAVTVLISLIVVALRKHAAVVGLAAVALAVWMSTAQITNARGAAQGANAFIAHLPQPLDWVDRATHGDGVTYLGQHVLDPTGVELIEFWNPSLKNVNSLDGTCCAPGPHLTPGLASPDGTLRGDSGTPYVLADNGVRVVGRVVVRHGDVLLTKIEHHPWRLRDAVYGRDAGGWIQSDGAYAYFGPEQSVGALSVNVGRSGFCSPTAPKAHVTVTVGTVALDQQNIPIVGRVARRDRFVLPNCTTMTRTFHVRPPLAVHVHVTPLVVPSDYGESDNRALGAQVAFSFKAR